MRAGQYWRLENLKSFDEFLARRFPESRRKAYYLMSIHEHLPPQARKDLKEVGWTKGLELAKLARRDEPRTMLVPSSPKPLLQTRPLALSDHFKSGHQLSLQNRPTGLAVQD